MKKPILSYRSLEYLAKVFIEFSNYYFNHIFVESCQSVSNESGCYFVEKSDTIRTSK